MSERYPGGIITKSPVTPAGPFAEGSAPGVWTLEQQAYWQAQGLWPNANNPTPNDPQFQYVTSLLHADGTNGGQNNTFLDSSTNNFTITRNGNTTQGSFSPYGSNWGNFFNGSSYIGVPNNAAFDFGTGSVTVEAWINTLVKTSYQNIVGSYDGGSNYWFLQTNGDGGITCGLGTNDISTATNICDGQWHHVAMVRNGSSAVTLYIDGAVAGTFTDSTNINTNAAVNIGYYSSAVNRYFTGYISNVRVTNTAVYTAAFTPSTTPLTAVSGTILLTSQSNRFIDNSSNNFTITVNGTPQVTKFSPFPINGFSNQYSTSVDGGSGYFGGDGNYLTSTLTGQSIGSGNFTIECWAYHNNFTGDPGLFQIGPSTTPNNSGVGVFIKNVTGEPSLVYDGNFTVGSIALRLNSWNHIAVVRSGSTITLYVNGVSSASVSNSTNYSDTTLLLGAYYSASVYGMDGYISNFRYVKGTAVYTSTFTPPTSPLTAVSNTQLLCNFTNAAIFDNAELADYETVSNAQISTSVKKYGTGSLFINGSTSYLKSNNAFAGTGLGNSNFTIECWLNTTNTNQYDGIFHIDLGGPSDYSGLVLTLSGVFASYSGSSWNLFQSPPLSLVSDGNWYHLALVRNGTNLILYKNGVPTSAPVNIGTNTIYAVNPGSIWIGQQATSGGNTKYIDDFRITKGYVRYWENFTPPTAAFPNFGGAPQIPAQDPQFDYTTLLLPGNGTNGAQNNTFLDSSTNNFTITRNGNTTQGTFSPFSQTGWSGFFNGTNQYCTLSSNASMDFGTGDFTIEAWVYTGTFSVSGGASRTIIGNSGNSFTMQLYIDTTSGRLVFGNTGSTFVQGSTSIANNQWMHVAVSRSGTTARLFVNGNLEASGSNSQNYTSGTIYLGSFDTGNGFWNGYISNLRIVKGTALYTSNFTPSTTPLTAVSNTALLTFQSNRFLDNSTNAYTVTAVNSPSVQPFSPFNPTSTYSTSVVGGSGYFDGTGDYLSVASNAAFGYGTGDFEISFWFYKQNAGDAFLIDQRTSDTQDAICLYITSNTIRLYVAGADRITSSTISLNNWNYLTVSRVSGTTKMFLNGIQTGSSYSDSTNYVTSPVIFAIRAIDLSSSPLQGYMSSARIVKGSGVTSQTVPTAPLTAITNTQLLTNFTNAGIIDATADNVLETVGNAQISTAQSKFGGSSMYFDGSGDVLALPASNQWNFSSGNWTIEGWIYPANVSGGKILIENTTDGTGGLSLQMNGSSLLVYINSTVINAGTLVDNTWQHIALVRYGSVMTAYINGVAIGTSSTTPGSGAAGLWIGARANASIGYNGYMQDVRITKGYARYVQPFTPPTQAFQLS